MSIQCALCLQLLCYACNWFLLYTLVRTYSNSMETSLTLIALAYWPWPALHASAHSLPTHRRVALLLAAVAVVVRPPVLIMWAVLGLQSILSLPKRSERWQFVAEAAVIGAAVLGCSLSVDRWMYGEWVVAPVNFFVLNSLHSIGRLYGTHPWHWYLTEATPVLLSFSFPLFLHSLYRGASQPLTRGVLPVLALTLLAYSSNEHKEYRFILPLLPLATLHCGLSLSTLSPSWSRRGAYTAVLVAGNLGLFLYFGIVHQSGPIAAVDFLAHRLSSGQWVGDEGGAASVHFWMPCHSAPLHTSLHVQPTPELRFLDCAPTLPPRPEWKGVTTHDTPGFAFNTVCTASELFRHSPAGFIAHVYNVSVGDGVPLQWSTGCTTDRIEWDAEDEEKPPSERRGGGSLRALPSHVVLYSTHTEDRSLSRLLSGQGYEEVGRFFHSHFDAERAVLVLERSASLGRKPLPRGGAL